MEPATDETSSEARPSLDLRARLTLAALAGFDAAATVSGAAAGWAIDGVLTSLALGFGALAVALLITTVLLGLEPNEARAPDAKG
jgi:hypothetical protein